MAKKKELTEEAWKLTDLYSPVDFYPDYILKENYYNVLKKKYPKKALMLTKCYFNKLKYNVRYPEDIEALL